ncbi:LRR receptor-like serine/threonine-protein kinase EFR [Prosopis cineraria]|uniref:LRR receptor-like serine/threonine-protein kinase EFR n=1 Tax=Prosopis cineraria TaxID=364024 RepID=UPI0024107AF9|nr:LRR receptor-like serine/threonine-protein kinase EFR [Prosopis cineraria]
MEEVNHCSPAPLFLSAAFSVCAEVSALFFLCHLFFCVPISSSSFPVLFHLLSLLCRLLRACVRPWFCFFSPASRKPISSLGNETDNLSLLKFKESIYDYLHHVLDSWNTSNHFCNWYGVTCDHNHHRVTELWLNGYGLRGSITPHIGNLSFVRVIVLNDNMLYREIPQEFGHLFRLQTLFIGNNTLGGTFAINITSCSELSNLSFGGHNLSDRIPMEIGYLHKLERLHLVKNNFSGQIPMSMWNLSSRTLLPIGENNLKESMPEEIGFLQKLRIFYISRNKLSGAIPFCPYNFSSLIVLDVEGNFFQETIPLSLASLKGLRYLGLSQNNLSGSIPKGMQDITSWTYLNVSFNMLEGEVPSKGVFSNASAVSLMGNKKFRGGISMAGLLTCPLKSVGERKHPNCKMIVLVCSVTAFLLLLSIVAIYHLRNRSKKSLDSPSIDMLSKLSYQKLHNATDGFSI